MADTLADVVENMDLGEGDSNGSTGTESKGDSSKGSGDGAGDSKRGSGESSDKSGSKGTTEDGSTGDGEGSSGSEDSGAEGDDPGYVADEVGDEDEPVVVDKKEEPPAASLPPDLQYVVDRLPVLSVRGKDGSDGKVQTFQVKAAGQLPDSFEFASKREELIFTQALASQEIKAQNLQNEYNYKQQQESAAKYSTQENEDIRHDIGDLQREGLLAKFKYAPTDKRFAEDAGVKQAQQVIDYMNEKNEGYTKQGRLYRISFADAFAQLANQGKIPATKQENKQAAEDSQRKDVSRRTAGGRAMAASAPPKARPARSMEDLLSRIDNMEF